MNKNLTEIVMISDRSGSMANSDIKEKAQEGINSFIREQAAHPGECRLTFVEFDDQYDVVHDGVPIKDVPVYDLIPRGGTALLDAIGKAMSTVGERLAKTPEDQRPGLVVCVISTDGLENSSKEYRRSQIAEMIALQRDTYNWQFQFLGAGIDALKEASDMEIPTSGAVAFAGNKSDEAYDTAARHVGLMRTATAKGASKEEIRDVGSYSRKEREELK